MASEAAEWLDHSFFSQGVAYFLRVEVLEEAVTFVKRTGLSGFILPLAETGSMRFHWVLMFLESKSVSDKTDILLANRSYLLQFQNQEEYGWGFVLFENDQEICSYGCDWRDCDPTKNTQKRQEIHAYPDFLDLDLLQSLFSVSQADREVLQDMLMDMRCDDLLEQNPADEFITALCLGDPEDISLSNNLSFSDLLEDYEKHPEELFLLYPSLIFVNAVEKHQ